MMCYFSELRYKEVIDIHTGFRLGYICDVELDDAEGHVVSLITPGRAKLTMCSRGAASSRSAAISSLSKPRANSCAVSGSTGCFEIISSWQIQVYVI